jgi:aarF domain-containing kinase
MGDKYAREAVVPRAYPELSTRRVLVMEMLPGPKLVDGLTEYAKVEAANKGLTVDELRRQIEADWDEHGIPDVYDGPSALQIYAYNTACAARDTLVNTAVWMWNGSVGWVAGCPGEYVKTTTPPNPPRIMDTIMRVHGDQLLRHGVFNADPHAGNFLLLPGRLLFIFFISLFFSVFFFINFSMFFHFFRNL